jgi:VCBS repeat protein/centrosomal CEP192-like protein/ASPM-SPD-2-Hydin domain-containing protein/FG-GAP repeat protein
MEIEPSSCLSVRAIAGLVLALGLVIFAVEVSAAIEQNPVPEVAQPMIPASMAPGGAGFTLTVNGTGFVSASVVNWNGVARATTFVRNTQVSATILASDVATGGTASVTVVNPAPGGGTSNPVFFPITNPESSVLLTRADLPTGAGASSVTAADFNQDGKLDLAVTNGNANSISILLGNGDGTFQPAVDYTTGLGPYRVIARDLNGDGRLDLVVTDSNADTVSILLGNADGTFQPNVDYATGTQPVGLVVGDFNGDGKLDLATTNAVSVGTVSILLGNGDGTFQTNVDYAVQSIPLAVAAGDLNGDGKLDLVVTNETSATVSVLLGYGDGTFQPHVDYLTAGYPQDVIMADFNGDGKLDLAVAREVSTAVTVFLGNGDGTFGPPVDYTSGQNPDSVVTGDFNGDGKLDLTVINGSASTVSILLGNGDGTFQAHMDYATGKFPGLLTAADFNGDGKLDFAVANNVDGTVSVLLQTSGVSLSNTSLTFGNQAVGTTSPAQIITLNNNSTATLNISGIAVSGDFAQTNNCGSSVAAGASCAINVTFTPTVANTRTGTLTISDDAPNSPQTVSLTGTGITSAVTLAPPTLTYAAQLVGTTSPPQSVTLTNGGNAALTIASVAASGDFAETNTCGSSVAAGADCTINITFTPTASGTRAGTLTITDSAPGSPQTVALSGAGQDFSIGVGSGSSTTATVSAGGAASYQLSIAPGGGLTGTVTLACSGAPAETTCTVNPASATLNGSSTATTTVTVTTTAPTMAAPRNLPPAVGTPPLQIVGRHIRLVLGIWLFILLVTVAEFDDSRISSTTVVPRLRGDNYRSNGGLRTAPTGAAEIRRHSARLLPWRWRAGWQPMPTFVLPALLLLSIAWSACGGGGGSNVVHDPGTPTGAYSLTVTATYTSGSSTLKHNITLMLTVD